MQKKHELIKNTAVIGIGVLFARAITFLLIPFYMLYIPPTDYGAVDLILTYVAYLAPFVIFQTDWAVFKFLIEARENKQAVRRITSTALYLIMVISLTSIIFLTLLSIFINISHLYYIELLFLSTIFSTVMLQYSRGLGQNIQYSISNIITGVLTIATFFIFVVLLNLGSSGLILSIGLSKFIGAAYLFAKLKVSRYVSLNFIDKKLCKKMIRYSWPLAPEGLSWWVINVSDRTIISIMIGVAANGIYAMANKYSLILAVAYSVLNLSWSQSISKHIDEKDNFVSDVCNITVRVFGSLGLIMIAFLPLVFSKLFTDSYGDAYYYIPILVLSNVFLSIAGIYSGIYIAKNLTRQIAKTTIAASVINIVVNLSLISFIGVYAAAISTFAAYLLLAIYRHYDTKKYVGIAYNIRVLVFLFVMYTIVTMLYYANNDIGNIASILIALTATFVLNGSIVRAMKDKILSFTSRKSISVDSNYGIKEEVS